MLRSSAILWGMDKPVVCTRCQESKPRSAFYGQRNGRPRFPCKECYRLQHRERYAPKDGADDAPRVCAVCGTSYQPKHRIASTYCSRACKDASRLGSVEMREKSLRQKYGIGIAEYDRMFTEQNGKCAICGGVPGANKSSVACFHVDHDHATGAVRGLLCQQCNHGLGNFRDDAGILARAIHYLRSAHV